MKNVMVRAWEIAKEGQKKFGGVVKEYFAAALKMAWAETRGSSFKEETLNEGIILIANHDKGYYNVMAVINGKVKENNEGLDTTQMREKYTHCIKNLGLKTVSYYTIKNGEKTFLETKGIA